MDNVSKDKVLLESSISKTSLTFFWCLIPGLYVFRFLVFYLPSMIKTAISSAAKEALAEKLGVQEISLSDIYSAIGDEMTAEIPGFILVFIGIMMGILIAAWFVFCLVWTFRATRNKLIFYSSKIYAESGSDKFEVNWGLVNDVFVEQGLLGRIFKYGNITISSKKGSFTVKNINKPQEFRRIFLNDYNVQI